MYIIEACLVRDTLLTVLFLVNSRTRTYYILHVYVDNNIIVQICKVIFEDCLM